MQIKVHVIKYENMQIIPAGKLSTSSGDLGTLWSSFRQNSSK